MQVGQTASRTLRVTSEHVRLYTEITGDRNPLHYDEAFVAGTKFGRLVEANPSIFFCAMSCYRVCRALRWFAGFVEISPSC